MTWTRRTAICCTGAGRASPGTNQLYRSPHARWMRCGVAMLRQSVRSALFLSRGLSDLTYTYSHTHNARCLPPLASTWAVIGGGAL